MAVWGLVAIVLTLASPTSAQPMQDAFTSAQNEQVWALSSMMDLVCGAILPASHPLPSNSIIIFHSPHYNLAGNCSGVENTSPGPQFVAQAIGALSALVNASVFALSNTSVITAADVLGGAHGGVVAVVQSLHDGITPTASGVNWASARWALDLTCFNNSYATSLFKLRGQGRYRQGMVLGSELYNATQPVHYAAQVGVATPFWGSPLQAAGACTGRSASGNVTMACYPSVPSAPSFQATILSVAPLVQAAAATCDSLELCASTFGSVLVNVGPACHDSATALSALQPFGPLEDTCMYF